MQNKYLTRLESEIKKLKWIPVAFSVKMFLQIFYHILLNLYNDMHDRIDLPIKHCIRSWRYGFFRSNYRLYELDRGGNPRSYLSDYQKTVQLKLNGRFTASLTNKLNFSQMMKNYGMPTPKVYGIFHKGVYCNVDANEQVSPSTFFSNLENGRTLVIKPNWGSNGFGFIKLTKLQDQLFLNGEEVQADQLSRLLAKVDNFLVMEFVEQGEYASGLFPDTVNTIRILTLWDMQQAKPFIARAVQRIGNSQSYPVDNFIKARGGYSARIDPQSGELGPAATMGPDGRAVRYPNHPETDLPIQGQKVPSWPEISRSMLEFAGKIPFLPVVGWDLAITKSGYTIIEANTNPALSVLQIHGPLLADERIYEFYKYHGMVSRKRERYEN